MAEWTSEAGEYLDGYLHQVAALVRQQGDDAEDILDGLRDHIMREAESSAGAMVTLDMLRKTLTGIGTPEQVAEGEAVLAPARKPEVPPGTEHPHLYPPSTQPPQVVARAAPRSRVGCCIVAAAALVLFVFIGIPALISVVGILVGLATSATRQYPPDPPFAVKVAQEEEQASGISDEGIDANSPMSVARAFIEALAANDIDAALEQVHPDERGSFSEQMGGGIPPIPEHFELQRESSDNEDKVQIQMKGGEFGVDLKRADGRWWVTK